MKWDKAVALSIVILGAFYAGYSGVSYFLKRQTVETTSEAVPKAVVEAGTGSSPQEDWLIVPEEKRPEKREHFADLIIPALGAQNADHWGNHEDELDKGVGHYAEVCFRENRITPFYRDTGTRCSANRPVGAGRFIDRPI